MQIHGQEVNPRAVIESWVGIVVSLVTILAAIASATLWAMAHFQTTDDARREAADIKRTLAWQAVGIANQNVLTLRNRVNDCDIRKARQPMMSELENAACGQYVGEYESAVERAKETEVFAKGLSR